MQTKDYSKIAKQVFEAHNKVRKDPKSFIPKLEEKLKYFEGNLLKIPGKIALRTQEGPSAVKECIEFLKDRKSVV